MPEPILVIDNVSKVYPGRRGMFGRSAEVQALKGISIAVDRGESFGLVGESGSGKTTLTRSILHLEQPTSGRILFEGRDLATLSGAELRRLRARVQIVFQDPYASLNPRMTVQDIVTEPMVVHQDVLGLGGRQRTERAAELLLLDEPTSALDVSVQAQVLNLLCDLQDRLGLTYFFISHDLAVVRYLCSRVALIYRGELVEEGETGRIFDAPETEYAQMLIGAMPEISVPR